MPPSVAPSPPRSVTRTWPAPPTSRASTRRCVREGEDRLGLPGAERSGALDRRDELGAGAAGGERCVDGEGVEPLRVADGVGQALADESRETVELGRRQRDAGGHGVAAALHGEPGLDGGAHDAAEIDARHRAARPGRRPVRPDREGEGRPAEALLEARRREPDDARMPAAERVTITAVSGVRSSVTRASASASATAACSIACRSRLRRSSSAASAPGRDGIGSSSSRAPSAASPMRPPALMRGPSRKPRCQHSGAARERRDVGERGESGPLPAAHDLQALAHEGAVQPDQRHDVGDGRERDEIEPGEKVGRRPRVPEAALAQARGSAPPG